MTRVHDFTAKVNEMKSWLDACFALGGGDGPEAVADGLHAALKLAWRDEATKNLCYDFRCTPTRTWYRLGWIPRWLSRWIRSG